MRPCRRLTRRISRVDGELGVGVEVYVTAIIRLLSTLCFLGLYSLGRAALVG